jgi:ATPase subunit of ABC transporter with duplicated ATPase domains
MNALQLWNGGVILISHDERFITTVSNEVCQPYPSVDLACLTFLVSSGYAEMAR